jgi:hypothetical protein
MFTSANYYALCMSVVAVGQLSRYTVAEELVRNDITALYSTAYQKLDSSVAIFWSRHGKSGSKAHFVRKTWVTWAQRVCVMSVMDNTET